MARNRKAEVDTAIADVDFTKFKYQVEFETEMGIIRLDLAPDVAPGHCRNIIGLAKVGFYDGLTFHRVVKGFVIQGGCPVGNGTGGPGYEIKAEFNAMKHVPGVLSMARAADPDSAGSQFFICLEKASFLDGKYTAFGQTADDDSLAVVRAIGGVKTGANDKPVDLVTIRKANVNVTPM